MSTPIITTSRKPSRKTRRLAKVLARYFNCTYIQRGKTPIDEFVNEDLLIFISEVKGNPAILRIFKRGKELLRIRFNVGEIKKVKMENEPAVILGKVPFNPTLLNAIPEKFLKYETPKRVLVKRKNGKVILDMRYKNETVVRMVCNEMGIQVLNKR